VVISFFEKKDMKNLKNNKKILSAIFALFIALAGGYTLLDFPTIIPSEKLEDKGLMVELERVIDGDTIVFNKNGKSGKMRLLLIDTPESTTNKTGEIQPYGKEAKEFLSDYLVGKKLTLEYEPTKEQEDQYERTLAYLFADGVLVQEELVRKGFARVGYEEGQERYLDDLIEAEQAAMLIEKNIWSIEGYVEEYRFNNK
jgi:micrococcal nuclease